jgi:hypothetical protein
LYMEDHPLYRVFPCKFEFNCQLGTNAHSIIPTLYGKYDVIGSIPILFFLMWLKTKVYGFVIMEKKIQVCLKFHINCLGYRAVECINM